MSPNLKPEPNPASASVPRFHCAFCGRDNRSVGKMIAGPGVAICDQCVGECQAIVDGKASPSSSSPPRDVEREDAPGPPFGAWSQLGTETLLSAVERTDGTIRAIRSIQNEQVAVLRARGTSWGTIGTALGISRQSAHERFAPNAT